MEITTTYLVGIALMIVGGISLLSMLAYDPVVVRWFHQEEAIASDPAPVFPLDPTSVPCVPVRSADAGPPAGAVEWVADIVAAIGNAPDGLVLAALVEGDSRDAARARWITQLEKTHVE